MSRFNPARMVKIGIVLLALNLSVSSAAAQTSSVLATIHADFAGLNLALGQHDGLAFTLRTYPYPDEFPVGVWIVGPLTTADLGRTFEANASSSGYPALDFKQIVDFLTSGTAEIIQVGVGPAAGGGGGVASFEGQVFERDDTVLHGDAFVPLSPAGDLAGYEIEKLVMTVRDVVIRYDSSTGYTAYQGAFSIDIIGRALNEVVSIDIKPGEFPNSINLQSAGVVPVAILGSATLDVATIDPATVRLAGAAATSACGIEDVTADRVPDLVCRVETKDLQLNQESTRGSLEARTFDGRQLVGDDSVRIVR